MHWSPVGNCSWYVHLSAQVSTVYSVAIGTPSFGDVGPLVIGLSLFACATSGTWIRPQDIYLPPDVRLQHLL